MRFLSVFIMLIGLTALNPVWAEDEEVKTTVGYHELKPSLVVNIQGNGKYMRCDVQLMTKDDANIADIQTHSPALRHELLMLLGDQKGEELKTPKGKEAVRVAALKAMQQIMTDLTGKEKIDDLYFTAFYVQ